MADLAQQIPQSASSWQALALPNANLLGANEAHKLQPDDAYHVEADAIGVTALVEEGSYDRPVSLTLTAGQTTAIGANTLCSMIIRHDEDDIRWAVGIGSTCILLGCIAGQKKYNNPE